MKTYRHTPTGKIAVYNVEHAVYVLSDSSTIPYNIVELGNDWQEICPDCNKPLKKGEDLHFKGDCECADKYVTPYNILTMHSKSASWGHWIRHNKNSFIWNKSKGGMPILSESLIKSKDVYISSIQRLPDETVFKIGDKVEHTNNVTTKVSTIVGFHLMSNGIWVKTKDYDVPLCFIKGLVKKPIYKTEDDVELFGGETVWYACKEFDDRRKNLGWKVPLFNKENIERIERRSTYILHGEMKGTNIVVFSTEEAAKKFIGFAFKSTDGVDIYEGDEHWFCDVNYKSFKGDWEGSYHKQYLRQLKVFSTEAALNEYIIYNSKVLSIKDIIDGGLVNKKSLPFLKKLVQSKIS